MAGITPIFQGLQSELTGKITVQNGDYKQVAPYCRIWNGQIYKEVDGKTYDFPKPALFVEIIPDIEYQPLGLQVSQADLGIRIHIVTESLDTGDGNFEQDLAIYDLRDKVISTLSGYLPPACSAMMLTAETPDYEHTNIFHHTVDFVCNFIDSTGSPYADGKGVYQTKESADLNLDVSPGGEPKQQPFKPIIS